MTTASSMLQFWFEELTAKQHFAKDAALNETIRARFGCTLGAAWHALTRQHCHSHFLTQQRKFAGWCHALRVNFLPEPVSKIFREFGGREA